MTDVVVTVPKGLWGQWLDEGDSAGAEYRSRAEYHFWLSRSRFPKIAPGERVYVVAHGRLRGYAPLVAFESTCRLREDRCCLLRRGNAVALTIPELIRGFQGWRYRWWDRALERQFPDWREP